MQYQQLSTGHQQFQMQIQDPYSLAKTATTAVDELMLVGDSPYITPPVSFT